MRVTRKACKELWPEKAEILWGVVRGTVDPETFESVQEWVRQCYHRPSEEELRLAALNEILGTFGTEAVFDRLGNVVLSYCNTGETYEPTLVYDFERGSFLITSLGDWVERIERRRGRNYLA